ncbi:MULTISPECIES: LysR family transcriptional regulator [Massilia]|jgi:DNA-binding transcriptional LysR family regulator|uniref:LysR family transcriptional regulator n=2 Tax=Massilia TaxID=149698 RepID=A0A7X3FXI8_9BURK|nr:MULTISPECIES: LysR family transcriptional regulator [Telluria group]KQY16199.1 LysR family transcriptional regulator [Massilia sp. Root133]KQZ46810.1 LysR family transcriptional regulator [Massilia sp. Root1485]MDN4042588.1 LysR family transcriptional regulator [Massilia sp. YIM B02787]MVW59743.1 LysR family transcriptional regulator [Telluria cellulosilytica]
MARDNLSDILVFLAVARERSFTRAAVKLGMTQSALSHTIRALEARLGVRLLTRTTRSVSPTEAGERLLQNVAPRLEEIDAEIAAVSELGDRPAGTVRITATDHVIDNVLWPRLAAVLPQYPDIHLEISSEYRMVDVAAERYDIGVRWGDQVEKDMIAVRLTPDTQTMIVGAPDYFAHRPVPASIDDLMKHECIRLRLAGGGVYAWEMVERGAAIDVRVRGRYTFNGVYQMLNAALSGNGLAYMTEDMAVPHLQAGRLVSVMADFCPKFPGLHAYYPSRRHASRALAVVLDAIRHQG